MTKTHDFAESLAKSHAQADSPIWELVYKRAFPTFQAMTNIRNDGWAQRGGIDRLVILSSGKTLKIDEKIREKDYDDILLEYWSDETNRTPGWIAKDLACDYIAYAFIPSKRCYLLPFHQLRLAWKDNKKQWVSQYFNARAQNKGYVTVSVAIPIDVLLNAITCSMVVSWAEN